MEYWTAFLIGLMGSAHCIGMCGPIALSLPYKDSSKILEVRNVLLYNSGRIISYGIIGVIPGLLGYGISIGGHQKTLSIVLGVIFVISAFFAINLERRIWNVPFIQKLGMAVQNRMSLLLKSASQKTFMGIGIVNGFLPCGLVYMAIAGAVVQSNILSGAIYMMVFGLGTIPLMTILAFSRNIISINIRNKIRKLIPIFMVGMGILFIFRGINVQLPFDLQLWLEYGAPPMCH